MTLAAWLAALVPTLISRALAALGVGILTVTGFVSAWNTLKSHIISNFNGLPSEIIGLMSVAGGGEALGILFGAITASLSYIALKKSFGLVQT